MDISIKFNPDFATMTVTADLMRWNGMSTNEPADHSPEAKAILDAMAALLRKMAPGYIDNEAPETVF
jgi:hypothetical protein